MASRAQKILDLVRLKARNDGNSSNAETLTSNFSDNMPQSEQLMILPISENDEVVRENPGNKFEDKVEHSEEKNVQGNYKEKRLHTTIPDSELLMELQPIEHFEVINENIKVLATCSHEDTIISITNLDDKTVLNYQSAKNNDGEKGESTSEEKIEDENVQDSKKRKINTKIPDIDQDFTVDNQSEESEEENDPNYMSDQGESTSEEELEQEIEVQSKKGKKRKRNPVTWKRNIRMEKKSAGEAYLSAKNKVMKKKEMKAACDGCRMKCAEKILNDDRELIYLQYWNKEMKIDQKRQYISSCIEEIPVERVRVRTGKRTGKRQTSLKYFFTVHSRKIAVCRTYFLNTLSISQTSIRSALAKRQISGVVTSDQRGKHEPCNKIKPEIRNLIRKHIQKFPCIESHYSRNKSSKKYLGSHLNITRMYRLFNEECLLTMPEEEIPKEWLYRDIFYSEFNLSFKEPGNDTCDACDEYTIKLKAVTSQEERNETQNSYDAHLLDADNRYKLKKQDKENSEECTKVLMVDLQKCLPTPVLTNAQNFYSLKLWTFNYTVYDATKKSASCYIWDESQAGRGGNEMSSCLLKYILGLANDIKSIIIWSDNCPSQNRNIQIIMFYLSLFSIKPSLKCIEHKFLLRGHTHMEVDTIHASIERQMKATSQFSIITPWDWQQLIKLCGPKFVVEGMNLLDFKNFNILYDNSASPFHNNKKTKDGGNFLISKVVHMKFLKETPGVLYFKRSFENECFNQVDFNKPKRVSRRLNLLSDIKMIQLEQLRQEQKPISTKKYRDLLKLLKWVPKQFHAFFENLSHGDQQGDDND